MFNRHFNLPRQLAEIPFNLRKQVLFSLVGSVNATLVGLADNLVRQLTDDGYRLSTQDSAMENVLDAQQIRDLMDDPDTSGAHLQECQLLSSLGLDLQTQLQALTDTTHLPEIERAGSMLSTLRMMTGIQSKKPANPNARKMLEAVGDTATDEEIEQARESQRAYFQMTADARSRRIGDIEFILDQVFTYDFDDDFMHGTETEDGDTLASDHVWARLPEVRREMLTAKLLQALNSCHAKARMNVINNVISTSTRDVLGAGDIPIIKERINIIQKDAYPSAVEVLKKKFATKVVDKDGKPVSRTAIKRAARVQRAQPRKRVKQTELKKEIASINAVTPEVNDVHTNV